MTISRNLASFANNLDTSGNIAGVNISLANVSGTLAVTSGGTGTTSATFVNLTSNVTGTLPVANGGTGLSAVGTSGNVLTSNGSVFISSAPAPGFTTGKAIAMALVFGG